LSARILLLTLALVLLAMPMTFAVPWWNTSVSNRIEINITNNAGASLTNFNVVINASSNLSKGFDTSNLISRGLMRSDCNDLWIINSTNDGSMPFYIENNTCNSANTIINFVTNVSINPNKFYIYFNASSETNHQNRYSVINQLNNTRGWFDFSEGSGTNTIDYSLSGTQYPGNGTLTNSPTYNFTGRGYALGLEGATDYVNTTSQMLYNPPNYIYSYEAWIWNSMDGTVDENTVFGDQTTGCGRLARAGTTGTGYSYLFWSGTFGDWIISPTVNMPKGQWTHFILAKNNTNITFYINGVSANSSILSYGDDRTGTGCRPFRFGMFSNPTGRNWNGTIDNFRLSYRFITPEEAKAKYDGLTFGFLGIENLTELLITFNFQDPADITTTNIFGKQLNISYNISSASDLNSTNFTYKTNSSAGDSAFYLNGTIQVKGWLTNTSVSISNATETYYFKLGDNEVYPGTYNFNEDLMESYSKSTSAVTTTSIRKERFYNVSGTKVYSFVEIYAQNQTGVASSLQLYYCNSSYVSGNVLASVNCVNFNNILPNTPFNHTHGANSFHYLLPLGINVTTQQIGSVKVTAQSYIVMRASAVGSWDNYYITNVSNSAETSANTGVTWTTFSGTFDMHIHQFDINETLNYYLCVTSLTKSLCSSVRMDLFEIGNLPPSAPIITLPLQLNYSKIVNITWYPSVSPNGYQIFYNVSLTNSTYGFISDIETNITALNSSYNSSLYVDGIYGIRIIGCDTNHLCATGFSQLFNIDNTAPIINITSPIGSINTFSVPITFIITETNLDINTCSYKINNGSHVALPSCSSSSTILLSGNYNITIYANDTFGNSGNSTSAFYVNVSSASVGSYTLYAYDDTFVSNFLLVPPAVSYDGASCVEGAPGGNLNYNSTRNYNGYNQTQLVFVAQPNLDLRGFYKFYNIPIQSKIITSVSWEWNLSYSNCGGKVNRTLFLQTVSADLSTITYLNMPSLGSAYPIGKYANIIQHNDPSLYRVSPLINFTTYINDSGQRRLLKELYDSDFTLLEVDKNLYNGTSGALNNNLCGSAPGAGGNRLCIQATEKGGNLAPRLHFTTLDYLGDFRNYTFAFGGNNQFFFDFESGFQNFTGFDEADVGYNHEFNVFTTYDIPQDIFLMSASGQTPVGNPNNLDDLATIDCKTAQVKLGAQTSLVENMTLCINLTSEHNGVKDWWGMIKVKKIVRNYVLFVYNGGYIEYYYALSAPGRSMFSGVALNPDPPIYESDLLVRWDTSIPMTSTLGYRTVYNSTNIGAWTFKFNTTLQEANHYFVISYKDIKNGILQFNISGIDGNGSNYTYPIFNRTIGFSNVFTNGSAQIPQAIQRLVDNGLVPDTTTGVWFFGIVLLIVATLFSMWFLDSLEFGLTVLITGMFIMSAIGILPIFIIIPMLILAVLILVHFIRRSIHGG